MADVGVSSFDLLEPKKPRHFTQYIGALSATMGALCFGTALGYASPAGVLLTSNSTDTSLTLTDDQNSWFSSVVNLGALAGSILGGVLVNLAGRRGTMLLTSVPFMGSWLLIALGQNFAMLISGRVIVGLCTGLTCISAPTYIGEIASADIRGMLGSGFQLMVVIGILYAYIFGAFITNWQVLAWVCAAPTILFFVLALLTKESPSYLLAKGREKEAREAMQYFRGEGYDIEPELDQMRQSIKQAAESNVTLSDLAQPYIMKPLVIGVVLMLFQQLSGVNAVLFNLNTIFQDAGTDIPDSVSAIIVGAVQVIATVASTFLVDRAGRRLLLLLSAVIMLVSLVALGVFFFMKAQGTEAGLGWLPITSLMVFIAAFSIGYGPIPWIMMSELFSVKVRGAASSISTMANWGTSFLVTFFFVAIQQAIKDYGVYWTFAGMCLVNAAFCLLVVPETKGKTLQEIEAMFGAPQRKESVSSKGSSVNMRF